MPTPHRIRLRAPWDLDREEGRVWLRRYFNLPTGLTAGSRVFVVVEGDLPVVALSLNGQSAPTSGVGRWELSSLLVRRNMLALEVHSDAPPDDFAVNLEIHDA
jgi:hypothetical protein